MKDQEQGLPFAVCIGNEGQEASLLIGKLYEVVPDAEADQHGYLRVIDECGEEYWHARANFYPVSVPDEIARTLHAANSQIRTCPH